MVGGANASETEICEGETMKAIVQWLSISGLVWALQVQAALPDFTDLVKDVAPAVVNISTRSTRVAEQNPQMPDLEQLPPFFREFFERERDFRAYLIHPKLNLPKTTNAMESTGKLVRAATRTARTPESLKLRAIAFLRLKRSVVCNGPDTPN